MKAKRWFATAAIVAIGSSLCAEAAGQQRIARAGTLNVRERFDDSSGLFVEGYVSYLVVRKVRSGAIVVKQSKAGFLRSSSILPPGSYRLRSYIRSCDANCGYLDAPSNSCSGTLRLSGGELVRARILRDANGCRVSIDG